MSGKKMTDWERITADRRAFDMAHDATVQGQLNQAFKTLRALGFDARRNAADCRSCYQTKNEARHVMTTWQGDRQILQRKTRGWHDPDVDAWVHLYWADAQDFQEFPDDDGKMQQYQQPDTIIRVLKANGLVVKPFNSNNYKTMQDEAIAIHSSALIRPVC